MDWAKMDEKKPHNGQLKSTPHHRKLKNPNSAVMADYLLDWANLSLDE